MTRETTRDAGIYLEASKIGDEQIFDYGRSGEYPPDLYATAALARGVDGFEGVDAAAIEQFHEQGYMVVENAFSRREIESTIAALLALIGGENPGFNGVMFENEAAGVDIDALAPAERQDFVRKFMWFVEYDARLKALAEHPQLLGVLEQLIGDTPELFQDMALIKPPRIGREKPWHQDHAYFEIGLEATIVGVWIALDEATVDNGCMVILPASHREGPVIHFSRRDWQICDTDANPGRRAVAVPLKPGSCLFFHSLIHHGTPQNRTDQRRRAVQFHYRPVSARTVSEEDRLALFGAEGKGAVC